MTTRDLRDLVNEAEPGWPWVHDLLAESPVSSRVLPCDRTKGGETLLALQVTTKSPMGAIAYGSAGIFLDYGWLRILGAGGHPYLQRSLTSWNIDRESEGLLIIADDVLGGTFALNGGALAGPVGHTHYFSPDSLEWEELQCGYSQFLEWTTSAGALEEFYESLRWEGWQDEVAAVSGDQAISVYPYLFTAGPRIVERSRRPIPVDQQLEFMYFMRNQLAGGEAT